MALSDAAPTTTSGHARKMERSLGEGGREKKIKGLEGGETYLIVCELPFDEPQDKRRLACAHVPEKDELRRLDTLVTRHCATLAFRSGGGGLCA